MNGPIVATAAIAAWILYLVQNKEEKPRWDLLYGGNGGAGGCC